MKVHQLPDNVQAVIFDVDNTIIKGTTVYHAASSMNLLPKGERKKILRLASHNIIYTLFSFENGLDFLKKEGLSVVKGCDAVVLKAHLQTHLQSKIDKKIYTDILEIIKSYKEENRIIILASAAPDFLVEIVATKVGADHYLATELQEKQGLFTGFTVGEVNHGSEKAANVKKLLESLNIEKLNVAAFTDSIKDIHLLNAAEHKIAVNPDMSLRYTSYKNNWTTLDVSRRYTLTKIVGMGAIAGAVYFTSKLLYSIKVKRDGS